MAKQLSAQHKEALALGRTQSAAIRRYLDAALTQSRRGSRRSADDIKMRLKEIENELEAAQPIKAVQLLQERLDLNDERQKLSKSGSVDIDKLRVGFVKHAKGYSESKGLTYSAWRELGVSAEDLRDAGIPATRRRS